MFHSGNTNMRHQTVWRAQTARAGSHRVQTPSFNPWWCQSTYPSDRFYGPRVRQPMLPDSLRAKAVQRRVGYPPNYPHTQPRFFQCGDSWSSNLVMYEQVYRNRVVKPLINASVTP